MNTDQSDTHTTASATGDAKPPATEVKQEESIKTPEPPKPEVKAPVAPEPPKSEVKVPPKAPTPPKATTPPARPKATAPPAPPKVAPPEKNEETPVVVVVVDDAEEIAWRVRAGLTEAQAREVIERNRREAAES